MTENNGNEVQELISAFQQLGQAIIAETDTSIDTSLLANKSDALASLAIALNIDSTYELLFTDDNKISLSSNLEEQLEATNTKLKVYENPTVSKANNDRKNVLLKEREDLEIKIKRQNDAAKKLEVVNKMLPALIKASKDWAKSNMKGSIAAKKRAEIGIYQGLKNMFKSILAIPYKIQNKLHAKTLEKHIGTLNGLLAKEVGVYNGLTTTVSGPGAVGKEKSTDREQAK